MELRVRPGDVEGEKQMTDSEPQRLTATEILKRNKQAEEEFWRRLNKLFDHFAEVMFEERSR